MRVPLAALMALILRPTTAQIAPSENCRPRSQAVAPGTYKGNWETECKLQGGAQHANLALVLRVKGNLKLRVGENERLLTAESILTSSFGGEGEVAGILTTSTQEGGGDLSLKDDGSSLTTPHSFLMSGSGRAKGELQVHSPVGSSATPTSGAGEFLGRFTLDTHACGTLTGNFYSEMLAAQMRTMASAGYQITWTKLGHWEAKAEGEETFAKRREDLRKELKAAQQTPQGVVYRREGEGRKLAAALEKIKGEEEPLKSCLLQD